MSAYKEVFLYRGWLYGGLTVEYFLTTIATQVKNQNIILVAIIRVKDGNEILGGYNPTEWKFDESFGMTKDSFYSPLVMMLLKIIF